MFCFCTLSEKAAEVHRHVHEMICANDLWYLNNSQMVETSSSTTTKIPTPLHHTHQPELKTQWKPYCTST